MALFDLNSRYTKSMEHGGSYERDASIGGYNRKELRGLNKQAKRGTLTQRERARLKYLTDERGGRRKRGLLSGLGGAAATLGALAAAGKLGGGDGEGGAGIMDAIKSRLAGAQEKSRLKKFRKEGSKELQDMFKKEAMSDLPGFGNYDPAGLQDIPLESEEDILRITDELDRNVDSKQIGKGVKSSRQKAEEEAVNRANQGGDPLRRSTSTGRGQTQARGTDPRDFSGELSEELGEGDLYEQTLARTQARDRSIAAGESAQRPVNPYLAPEGRSDAPGSHVEQALLEMARDEASRVSSENPLPTGITSTPRNTGSEVTGLKSRSVDLGSDFPAEIPAKQATRGSNRPNVRKLLNALNRSKPSEIDVDPEGMASDQSPGAAQTLLDAWNDKRRELGLEPAIQLTTEMIEETEGMDPRDRVTPQLMTRRPARQILNRYN